MKLAQALTFISLLVATSALPAIRCNIRTSKIDEIELANPPENDNKTLAPSGSLVALQLLTEAENYEEEVPELSDPAEKEPPTPSSNLVALSFIAGASGKEILSSEFNSDSITGIEQTSVRDNALVVTYPANSFKSPKTGGFQFISKPIEEADEMTLSYSIEVPEDFDFVKGYVSCF
jgi:hypothetical protein